MEKISQLRFDVYDIINLCQAVGTALDLTNLQIEQNPELKNRLQHEVSKYEDLNQRLNDEYKRLSAT